MSQASCDLCQRTSIFTDDLLSFYQTIDYSKVVMCHIKITYP